MSLWVFKPSHMDTSVALNFAAHLSGLPVVKIPCLHTVAKKSRGFQWIQLTRADLLLLTKVVFTNTFHRLTLPRRRSGHTILPPLQQSRKSRRDIKTLHLSTRSLLRFQPPR